MLMNEAIGKLILRNDLDPGDAGAVMATIMEGNATPAQVGGFLTALRMKGETPAEIAAFTKVMREHSVRINPRVSGTLVDTCGTGGDGAQTFNISTAAAFVAAGAGVPVVKHGNRGVSSRCGSADVIAELGISLSVNPESQERIVEGIGIAFLYAPDHHPAMRHVMTARRDLGCRTVFNLLGPLANPAGAQAQVLGVYHPDLTSPIADALRILGTSRAMVVHGSGLDEITTTGETQVSELDSGCLRDYTISPGSYGFPTALPSDLCGGDAKENARILTEILHGGKGAARDIVLLNAGAAIYVGGKARDLHEGCGMAARSIDSGNALGKLDALVRATREAA